MRTIIELLALSSSAVGVAIYSRLESTTTGQIRRFVHERGSRMALNRHDRRSQRTQQALIEALLALLAEKHYDEISIYEIVDRANVGRSTFYAHYQSKDELLKSGFERALNLLIDHVRVDVSNQEVQLDTTPLFRHAQGHYDLFRTLAWGSGLQVITGDGHEALSAKLQERLAQAFAARSEPSIPLPIVACSLAGTLLILLKWWLDHKMPYPPERMDTFFQHLAMPGAQRILGDA